MNNRTSNPNSTSKNCFMISKKFVPTGTKDDPVKKNEAARAMKEFKRTVEEEERRIKAIADKENKRLMKVLKEKQEDSACPLCLEDLPAIIPPRNESAIYRLRRFGSCCCGDLQRTGSIEAVFSAFIAESDKKAIISGRRGQRRVEGSAFLTHACYFEMWFHQVR